MKVLVVISLFFSMTVSAAVSELPTCEYAQSSPQAKADAREIAKKEYARLQNESQQIQDEALKIQIQFDSGEITFNQAKKLLTELLKKTDSFPAQVQALEHLFICLNS